MSAEWPSSFPNSSPSPAIQMPTTRSSHRGPRYVRRYLSVKSYQPRVIHSGGLANDRTTSSNPARNPDRDEWTWTDRTLNVNFLLWSVGGRGRSPVGLSGLYDSLPHCAPILARASRAFQFLDLSKMPLICRANAALSSAPSTATHPGVFANRERAALNRRL